MTTQKRISSALLSAKSYLNKNLKSHSQSRSVHGSPVPIVSLYYTFSSLSLFFPPWNISQDGKDCGGSTSRSVNLNRMPVAGSRYQDQLGLPETTDWRCWGCSQPSVFYRSFFFFFQGSSGHPQKCGFLHIWNNTMFLVIISWSPLWIKGRKEDMDYNLKISSLAVWCCPAQI